MIQKKTVASALSGVLVGGLLLTGGLAFAGDAKDSVTKSIYGKMPFMGQFMGHRGDRGPGRGLGFGKGPLQEAAGRLSQDNLDQLVKAGVITQDKANEIKAYVDKTKKEAQEQDLKPNGGKGMKVKPDLLSELVTNRILTQDQADAIKDKLNAIAQQQKSRQMADMMKALVEKGTISQEQSDKIIKQYQKAEEERQALAEKLDNMTVKEYRQYIRSRQGNQQNPVEQLVADGVLTQAQVDAMQKAMADIAQEKNQQRIADGLKGLVDKGTINQEQADKILAVIESLQKERAAFNDKRKSMTKEERRQYKEDGKDNQDMGKRPLNALNKLVEDGTITEDQAKAVGQVVPMYPGFGVGKGRR